MLQRLQKLERDVQVEDPGDANRPEEAHERRLSRVRQVVDVFPEEKYYRRAPDQEDQDAETNESWERDDAVVGEEACVWGKGDEGCFGAHSDGWERKKKKKGGHTHYRGSSLDPRRWKKDLLGVYEARNPLRCCVSAPG